MNLPTIFSARRLPTNRLLKLLSLVLLFTGILAVSGCGGVGPKDVITGKVTLNSQPVSGTIKFSAAGKEASGPVVGTNGSYTVENPPKGECDVTITGLGPAGGTKPPAQGGAKGMDTLGGAGGVGSQTPPAKYAQPGLLKFTYNGGKATKDFDLSP